MHPGLLDVSYRFHRWYTPLRRIVKLIEYTLNMAVLLAKFAGSRPEVVHVQFLPMVGRGLPLERWWLWAVRAIGCKVVYTVHNVEPQDGPRNPLAYRRIYRVADRLVCHDSPAARRLIAEYGIEATRVVAIPHGPLFERPSLGEAASARKRLELTPDEPVVLWQGIIRPYKGLSFLLSAWQAVCEADSSARLAIAGTGDPTLLRSVREEVRTLHLEPRVRLDLRFVPLHELEDWYTAADILVYPYSEITTSGALLTGIVRGKAIVATRLPAFEQLLRHGETALLVDFGDVAGLAGALLRLIRDEGLRKELRERLAERQAGIPRWTEIAQRTCECYRGVVSEQGAYLNQTA